MIQHSVCRKQAFVSVIIPVYNSEPYLARCIQSLLSQTCIGCMEILFVDDGSTDNSGSILDKAAFDEHIRVYHIQHGGVSHARNIGLDNANGKYISFLDSDDYIEEDYFESLLKEFSGDLIGGGFTAEYPDKRIPHICRKKTVFCNEDIIRAFLLENELSPIVADKLFLRDKIGDLRFNESLAMAEDREFLFRYLQHTSHITVVPFGKYHYVMNDDSACRGRFDERKLQSLTVCEIITDHVRKMYPSLLPYARCSETDMQCRVYGEMYYFGVSDIYAEQFCRLKKQIREFSLFEKYRCSSMKHTLALISAKISPALYMFLKNDMKWQYR